MDRIEADLRAVVVKVDKNNADTAEILEIIRTFKGIGRWITRTSTFVGKWAKRFFTFAGWAAGVAAPLVVLWYAIKNGKPPP